MKTADQVIEQLKTEGKEIGAKASKGDKKALEVIKMYDMVYKCPGDPGARVFLVEAYNSFKRSRI